MNRCAAVLRIAAEIAAATGCGAFRCLACRWAAGEFIPGRRPPRGGRPAAAGRGGAGVPAVRNGRPAGTLGQARSGSGTLAAQRHPALRLAGRLGAGGRDEGKVGMADTERAVAQRDPDALVREIERTRENLAQTIDALTDRVSPGNVARRGLDRVREQLNSPEGRLIGGAAAAVVVLGVAVFVWRRRRG